MRTFQAAFIITYRNAANPKIPVQFYQGGATPWGTKQSGAITYATLNAACEAFVDIVELIDSERNASNSNVLAIVCIGLNPYKPFAYLNADS